MATERRVNHERDNFMISLPDEITTDDGRRIMVTAWNPRLAVDEAPSVVIEAIIMEAN